MDHFLLILIIFLLLSFSLSEEVCNAQKSIPYEEIILGDEISNGKFGSTYHGYFSNSTLTLHLIVKKSLFINELSSTCKMRELLSRDQLENINYLMSYYIDNEAPLEKYIVVFEYIDFFYPSYEIALKSQYPNDYEKMRYNLYSELLYYALKALSAMHSISIIHCDVWYENFLTRAQFSPLLTDFGLAIITDYPFQNVTITNADYKDELGLQYPQFLFHQPFNALFDIYSLGMTLYNLIFPQAQQPLYPGYVAPIYLYLANKFELINYPPKYFQPFKGDLLDFKELLTKCMFVPQYERCSANDILTKYFTDDVKAAFKLK